MRLGPVLAMECFLHLGPVLAMKCFLADVVCSHHGNAVSSDSGVRCLKRAGGCGSASAEFSLDILKEK